MRDGVWARMPCGCAGAAPATASIPSSGSSAERATGQRPASRSWEHGEIGRPPEEVDDHLLLDVDLRREREVAELLQPLLGAVEETLGIGEQDAVLEAEVDVLLLRADPGEGPLRASIWEPVADPAPAAPDALHRLGHRDADEFA